MARARTKLPISTSTHDIERVSKRQQAAALLVAAQDALKVTDAANGTVSVRSHDGKRFYAVVACPATATMQCECRDFAGGCICKHLRAAMLVLKNTNAYATLRARPLADGQGLTLPPR